MRSSLYIELQTLNGPLFFVCWPVVRMGNMPLLVELPS